MSIRFTGNYPQYRADDSHWRVQGRKFPFIAENAARRFRFEATLASFFLECDFDFTSLDDDGNLTCASWHTSVRALRRAYSRATERRLAEKARNTASRCSMKVTEGNESQGADWHTGVGVEVER